MCPIGAAGWLESQFAKRADCLFESSLNLPQHAAEHRPKRPTFAHSLECWPDDASYYSEEEERWNPSGAGQGHEERRSKGLASESFIPSGTFPSSSEEDAANFVPKAEAIFTGHVLAAELLTNGHSGRKFHHVHVRTLGGEYDVVADPEVVRGEPLLSGVVQGVFWLTGRLVRDGNG
jgi:hypothetical protein